MFGVHPKKLYHYSSGFPGIEDVTHIRDEETLWLESHEVPLSVCIPNTPSPTPVSINPNNNNDVAVSEAPIQGIEVYCRI